MRSKIARRDQRGNPAPLIAHGNRNRAFAAMIRAVAVAQVGAAEYTDLHLTIFDQRQGNGILVTA